VDQESGLYHQEHFEQTMRYEMARVLEAEKPLGLMIVSLKKNDTDLCALLGDLFKKMLRKIDVPARLSTGELAVIFPRVNLGRLSRLVEKVEEVITAKSPGLKPRYGFAFYRPNSPEELPELLNQARFFMDAGSFSESLQAKSGHFAESALLAEEKETLFKGFSSLCEDKPKDFLE
jgi:GGDEF domain-containing protein